MHQAINKWLIYCIVFVCEFIELDSCLVGPKRYPWGQNSEYVCFDVLLQTIRQTVIDPTTLKKYWLIEPRLGTLFVSEMLCCILLCLSLISLQQLSSCSHRTFATITLISGALFTQLHSYLWLVLGTSTDQSMTWAHGVPCCATVRLLGMRIT